MNDPDKGRYEAHKADLQADAWEKFVMNGDTAALADYFSNGGKFEGQERAAAIDILRNGPPKNPGGRNLWRDHKTYVDVEWLYACAKLAETNGGKKATRRKALDQYAKQTHQELRTVERQHKRGSKIFGPGCADFETVEDNCDK